MPNATGRIFITVAICLFACGVRRWLPGATA